MARIPIGGILVTVNELSGERKHLDFDELRRSTNLLPEVLVEALTELRYGGCITLQNSATGNPFGHIAITDYGQRWIEENCAQAVEEFRQLAPLMVSSRPERTSRRGGQRVASAVGLETLQLHSSPPD